jgi:23S rRNA pseudouridine1911/1915/1917 synthase
MPDFPLSFTISADDVSRRLDQFLVAHFPDLSRARLQEMIAEGKVTVNGHAGKPSYKLRAADTVEVTGPGARPPLRAIAEDIPLDIVYEDDDLAVVNKPAGMMVHAGAGATDDERNRGTLVNALLHRFGALSGVGGELRPGIVHRLDRETSGLMIVAKNDLAHSKLSAQFSGREVKKTYIALVHGWPTHNTGSITAPIARDAIRRIRMTTRRSGGRTAVSHWKVLERIESRWGKFALVEVRIETGRTHQIRVHMSSIGHAVVGDSLYGAPAVIRASSSGKTARRKSTDSADAENQPPLPDSLSPIRSELSLSRNFLHSARVEFLHPRTREPLRFESSLPPELTKLLETLRHQ